MTDHLPGERAAAAAMRLGGLCAVDVVNHARRAGVRRLAEELVDDRLVLRNRRAPRYLALECGSASQA